MISDSDAPTQLQRPKNRSRTLLIVIVLGIGVIAIRWVLGYPLISLSSFNGRLVEPPVTGVDFALTATTGKPMALHEFRNRVTLIYFGYTFCPDVCPTTLAKLAGVLRQLTPDERDSIQVLMVTVDPQRDTQEKLKEYLAHFDPSFIGFTGSDDQIAKAAAAFNITYTKHAGSVESGYLVDHTASVAVVDQEGTWRLIFPYELGRDLILADLTHLLRK
ncbi:MAG: SCO family protein [Caldilineaceae bacterium]